MLDALLRINPALAANVGKGSVVLEDGPGVGVGQDLTLVRRVFAKVEGNVRRHAVQLAGPLVLSQQPRDRKGGRCEKTVLTGLVKDSKYKQAVQVVNVTCRHTTTSDDDNDEKEDNENNNDNNNDNYQDKNIMTPIMTTIMTTTTTEQT